MNCQAPPRNECRVIRLLATDSDSDSPRHRLNERVIMSTEKKKRYRGKKKNQATTSEYTFPSLHERVVEATNGTVFPLPWLNEAGGDGDRRRFKNTSIMGHFVCRNNTWFVDPIPPSLAPRYTRPQAHNGKIQLYTDVWVSSSTRPGWGSKIVAIHIREYHDSGYNAVVYGQRCNKCNRFGDLTLDDASYVDRVSYRVMQWAGVPMPRREHGGKSKAPHEKNLCEGCKQGHCPWTNSNNAGFSD